MSKLDPYRILKKVKARTDHLCSTCGKGIPKGETYYREDVTDRFLQSLHARKFCAACYSEFRKSSETQGGWPQGD